MSRRGGGPFLVGVALVAAGVALDAWDYLDMGRMGYRMAGTPSSARMYVGMALLLAGLAVAFVSLARPIAAAPESGRLQASFEAERFGRSQAALILLAAFALAVDVMKPATLGFVLPGLRSEYGLSRGEASLLPLIALTGTAIGSLVWGGLADRVGRRPTVLMSMLLFISTSVCGSMPSFDGNLMMCFFMGASAGGLLPVMLTLLAEIVPRRRRAFVVVMVSVLSATAGYLLASGAAALLEPHFNWRVLWLIGAPIGAVLAVLQRFVPESPRFLIVAGRRDEAVRVMQRFGLRAVRAEVGAPATTPPRALTRGLFGPANRRLTIALTTFAVGWGLVNFGFLTWVPTMLSGGPGLRSAGAVSSLLATAALIGLPATLVAPLLYSRWSARRALLGAGVVAGGALIAIGMLGAGKARGNLLAVALVALIASVNAMNAMLIPYAAELYPTELRARATGVVAGAGKLGGIAGVPIVSALLLLAAGPSLPAVVLTAALGVGVVALAVAGAETTGEMTERGIAAEVTP